MFAIDRILLVAALLLLVGIASSRFSARFGLPGLVLFIALGMLAGSEGVGGIEFDNYTMAHGFGTVALAIILFDGGLRTSIQTMRPAIAPAVVLATVGVLLTAVLTGFAAHAILDLSILEGLLLGGIIASTDAAAVFAILRNTGLNLPPRISATLEAESGSNDPMAVFITIGVIGLLTGTVDGGAALGVLFLEQMLIGGVLGVAAGAVIARVLPKLDLSSAALYPLFTLGGGLLAFGATALLGGSGFLAVYLAGIVIGNREMPAKRGILLFHDGLAWLSQIGMFVLMGLLAFPSRLLEVAVPALLIAVVLVFVARPVAVLASLAAFRFSPRELTFISWAGVKGAVPIILATYPLMFGLPQAALIFNVVFFVVLVSVLAQGWSLPLMASLTNLRLPARAPTTVSLELDSLKHIDADIVDYTVSDESALTGRTLRELALPEGAVVAMISRDSRVIPPRGNTRLEIGDHLFVVVSQQSRGALERAFAEQGGAALRYELVEFSLSGEATVSDLRAFYGISLAGLGDEITLDEALRERLGPDVHQGSLLECG
ncbi:MAG TPA: potassium/proton antiporter, partial [Gemmatimonadaceae bacterium]|nr:potassium/proton antiporter [Gemmatimonadaceae bacterium]